MSFYLVNEFENAIADYFGSPYAVATDSCTHSIELCLRYLQPDLVGCPKQTYISIPFSLIKTDCDWYWTEEQWEDWYWLENTSIIDAAPFWKEQSYVINSFMCLSFQFQKHLSLGRGGMILLDKKEDYVQLKKMSYDGRLLDTPWKYQNIDSIGYHYYMTPETADLGLQKLDSAKTTLPKKWSYRDYPDLSCMEVFK